MPPSGARWRELYRPKASRQVATIRLNTSPRGHSGPSTRSRLDKWLMRVSKRMRTAA